MRQANGMFEDRAREVKRSKVHRTYVVLLAAEEEQLDTRTLVYRYNL
jgi:hypothetical protein